MNWTREQFEQDRERYQREIIALKAQGFEENHPLIMRQRRRIDVVNQVLAVPAPHPTCIDVTGTDQTPRSEWACVPECPKEA